MKTIKELSNLHKCDKAADGHHTYDKAYEFHFDSLRDKPIKLLELGVGGYDNPNEGGASLRMWKEYFTNPETQIYSIDIFEKSKVQEDRITIWQGSQDDEVFLNKVIDEIGEPDIILDDAAHTVPETIASFKILFHKLKSGGIYVIEDLLTAYFLHYGGSNTEENTVGFIKSFVHGLNYKEQATEDRDKGRIPKEPNYFDLNITSIHFYHNIVFIYKGDNSVTA